MLATEAGAVTKETTGQFLARRTSSFAIRMRMLFSGLLIARICPYGIYGKSLFFGAFRPGTAK